MDTGEGYSRDIKLEVIIKKTIAGDIVLSFSDNYSNEVSFIQYPPDGDISRGLETIGVLMRRHYDRELKDKFLEWVLEPEPIR